MKIYSLSGMRVAYVAEWDFSQVSGVSQKILSQLKCWRELGVEAEGFFVTPELPDSALESSVHLFSATLPGFIRGSLRTYLNKIRSASKVVQALRNFKPDVIYYRQNIGYPGLLEILEQGKVRVVELNSLDLNEIELESWFKKKLYLSQREAILQVADGFCPVSNEIGKSVAHYGKPQFVCGNGIDFAEYAHVQRRIVSDRPQVIFVGSPGQAWHGLDRLNRIARSLPDVDFHVVGPGAEELEAVSSNMRFYGKVIGPELLNLYSGMDVGIGPLALSANKMSEASPLKTREYGALGMPFIVAYRDTDLPPNLRIVSQVPDTEQLESTELAALRSFIFKHKHSSRAPEEFRIYFDRNAKESKRLHFFEKILLK